MSSGKTIVKTSSTETYYLRIRVTKQAKKGKIVIQPTYIADNILSFLNY